MFSHYNLPHLTVIVLTLLACFLTTKLVKTKPQASVLRRVLIIGLLTKFLWYHLWEVFFEPNSTWKVHLPLHISQTSLFLMITALSIRKRKTAFYQFTYYWVGWASVVALLFPELHNDFPHPKFFEFFLGYLFLLTGISYICFVEKIKMTYKYLWVTVGVLVLYSMVIYPFNLIFETNFLFLREPPQLSGSADIFPAPPWHVPLLVLIVLLLLHLQYLPYYVARKQKLKRRPQ